MIDIDRFSVVGNSTINLGWFGLRTAEYSPKRSETVIYREGYTKLKVLDQYDDVFQNVRRLALQCFGDRIKGVFIIGSAARAEVRGKIEVINDLDFFVAGISQIELISPKFIQILSDLFIVKIVAGSIDTNYKYLEIYDKAHPETKIGAICNSIVHNPGKELTDDFVLSTLQTIAVSLVAIEVLYKRYKAVEGYSDAIEAMEQSACVSLPVPSGLRKEDPRSTTAMLRIVHDLVTYDIYTISLAELNKMRDYWFAFRRQARTEEEALRISESVSRVLRQGFEDARSVGLEEKYFAILCHVGILYALFPVTWSCASRYVFCKTESGVSILDYLRRNGFTLDNLGIAIYKCIDRKTRKNLKHHKIPLHVRKCTSYYENAIMATRLLLQDFPLSVINPLSSRTIPVYYMWEANRPLYVLSTDETYVYPQYMFWRVFGPYVEAMVFAEILRTEAALKLAAKLVGIKQPTSTFDRIAIVYDRVQTILMWSLASGDLFKDFQRALQLEETYFHTDCDLAKIAKIPIPKRFETYLLHIMVWYFREKLIDSEMFSQMFYIWDQMKGSHYYVFD